MTLPLSAQNDKNNIQLQYTTEGQYKFHGSATWANLLSFQTDISTKSIGAWKKGQFNVQLISIYKSSKDKIADDLQVFSNINEDNLLLGVFTLGYTHYLGKVSLFAGLRNVNRDYFTAPYTSLFTNSSCGIYPTLSANFDMANYPLSAMCLHLEYQITKSILLKNSLYNGVAHGYSNHWRDLFNVSPRQDGLFNITQLSFTNNNKNGGTYGIGYAMINTPYEDSDRFNYSLWGNIEQNVYKDSRKELGILLQAGYAPQDRNYCQAYIGAGAIATGLLSKGKKDKFGLNINKAFYNGINETAVEAIFSYQISKALLLQPNFHYIITGGAYSSVGMLRAVFTLN